MAGQLIHITNTQKPKVSKYLDDLLNSYLVEYGEDSPQYKGLYNQYYKMPLKSTVSELVNRRHYEAEVDAAPVGVERLYRRVVVIDLLSNCSSECVYCLRGMYGEFTRSRDEILEIAKWASSESELREVLITGGDPFTAPTLLKKMITALVEHAPNIRIIRIGTRLPVQDPKRAMSTTKMLRKLKPYLKGVRIEVGCQINHPAELTSTARKVLTHLVHDHRVYSQNVILRDVNDDELTLLELYDTLRYLGIEGHYLFGTIPMKGTDEFRVPVRKCLDIVRKLSSSGILSGRSKPQFALMTDAGKVNMYVGSVVSQLDGQFIRDKDNNIFVISEFSLADRQKWHPGYRLPDGCELTDDGKIIVPYKDVYDEEWNF